MIPCELDIISALFCDTTIITYEIKLPPYGNNISLNLLDYEDLTIPHVIDTISALGFASREASTMTARFAVAL